MPDTGGRRQNRHTSPYRWRSSRPIPRVGRMAYGRRSSSSREGVRPGQGLGRLHAEPELAQVEHPQIPGTGDT